MKDKWILITFGVLVVAGTLVYMAINLEPPAQRQPSEFAYQWDSPDIPKDAFRFEIFSDLDAGDELGVGAEEAVAEIVREHLERIFPPGSPIDDVDAFFADLARVMFAEDQKRDRLITRSGRNATRSCGDPFYDNGVFCSHFADKLSVPVKDIHWCRYENALPKEQHRAEMPGMILIWDVCIGLNQDRTTKSWYVDLGTTP